MLWFEEFARRLRDGAFGVEPIREISDDTLALSLFPKTENAGLFRAVTRGVVVEACTLFVPEQSGPGNHFFTYSIRFSLLSVRTPPEPQNGTKATPKNMILGGNIYI